MEQISILGTLYTIVRNVDPKDDKDLTEGIGGYCDSLKKKIVLADVRKIEGLEDADDDEVKTVEFQNLRHEIIHAYLRESGLWCNSNPASEWAMNEEMVDWFTLQAPKIYKSFEEAKAI